MAKKSKSKPDSKKADRAKEAEKAAAAKKAERKAEAAAKKKAAAKADALTTAAKKARKVADKAAKAAAKAETKAAEAAEAAGRTVKAKPAAQDAGTDELGLAKLALRAAEAKLTATEHRLEQVQQELEGERRLQDEAVQAVLEDAIVDAAVEATVEEAVLDAVLEADVDGGLDEALVVEAVAVDLEAIAEEADLPDEAESHAGDAAEAAEVFEQAGILDGEDQQGAESGTADAEGEAVPTESQATEGDAAAQPQDGKTDASSTATAPPLPSAPVEGEPTESWTLLQLRGEAKRRGLTGTSNLPKAKLLERLRAG